MACMCGDLYCHSCGPAQGNHYCINCGKWTDEGGCEQPEVCAARIQEADEEYYRQWAEEDEWLREQRAKGQWIEVK